MVSHLPLSAIPGQTAPWTEMWLWSYDAMASLCASQAVRCHGLASLGSTNERGVVRPQQNASRPPRPAGIP